MVPEVTVLRMLPPNFTVPLPESVPMATVVGTEVAPDMSKLPGVFTMILPEIVPVPVMRKCRR